MLSSDDSPCIEDIEPVFWNAGVTAHIEPSGQVMVEVLAPDPMPLTPIPFIPSI